MGYVLCPAPLPHPPANHWSPDTGATPSPTELFRPAPLRAWLPAELSKNVPLPLLPWLGDSSLH